MGSNELNEKEECEARDVCLYGMRSEVFRGLETLMYELYKSGDGPDERMN